MHSYKIQQTKHFSIFIILIVQYNLYIELIKVKIKYIVYVCVSLH